MWSGNEGTRDVQCPRCKMSGLILSVFHFVPRTKLGTFGFWGNSKRPSHVFLPALRSLLILMGRYEEMMTLGRAMASDPWRWHGVNRCDCRDTKHGRVPPSVWLRLWPFAVR